MVTKEGTNMNELKAQLLEEYIELAYAERGYAPLDEQETNQLIQRCIDQVESDSYPPTQTILHSASGK